LLIVLFVLAASAQGAEARPNILWLIAEDMGPALGCYGQKEVRTPNLDKLAAEGMRFTHFYTTAPSARRAAPHFSPECFRPPSVRTITAPIAMTGSIFPLACAC
jgi:hypothetical protein